MFSLHSVPAAPSGVVIAFPRELRADLTREQAHRRVRVSARLCGCNAAQVAMAVAHLEGLLNSKVFPAVAVSKAKAFAESLVVSHEA